MTKAIRGAVGAAAFAACLLLLLPPVAEAKLSVQRKKQIARTSYDEAERLREALNGRPESERSRKQYDRVIAAYRKVYYTAPTSSRAADSVVAVAELLAEEGRILQDPKASKDAIGQYEFLRKEYPGSPERIDGLFSIGQIYMDDLNDNAKAKASFDEFLQRYPHHRLAEDAKDALKEIADGGKKPKAAPKESAKKAPARDHKSDAIEAKDAKSAPAPTEVADAESKPDASPTRSGALPLVTGVRYWTTPDYTRVAIDIQQEVKYEAGRIPSPDRIFFDLHDTKLAAELKGKSFEVSDGFLKKIRVAQYQIGMTRVVLEVDDVSDYSAFILPNPYRLIIDIHGKKSIAVAKAAPAAKSGVADKTVEAKNEKADKTDEVAKADLSKQPDVKNATSKPTSEPTFQSVAPRPAEPRGTIVKKEVPAMPVKADRQDAGAAGPDDVSSPKDKKHNSKSDPDAIAAARVHEAKPASNGDRSLIRALGLKIGKIVVDAGHGGHDTGTIGPTGYEEKDLTLDVAMRLGKLLEDKLGAEVVYTRDDDTFVPLETRTAIANREQADLFISVHANSSHDPSARGVETYYLNFTSSADALEVAARENAVSEQSIHELQDLVKKIALKEKIEESREFASMVQTSLWGGLSKTGVRNRGVKKAPFVVLIGANMPSILAEISFVSNPGDERRLKTAAYRQKVSESLYKGVAKYVGSLSGVKLASKGAPGSGQ